MCVGAVAATLVVAAIALLSLPSLEERTTEISHSLSEREYERVPYAFTIPVEASSSSIVMTEPFVPNDVVKHAFEGLQTPTCLRYRAGVVNHHALAADLLAQSAKTLKACRPDLETLVIIAPDHFYRGTHALTSSLVTYRANDELIKTDEALQKELLTDVPNIGQQADVFKKEHGIAALVPFYAHEFDGLNIVPLTVKGRVTDEEAKALVTWIEKTLKRPKTFVLVSADMSHYLSKEQALKNDEKTQRAFAEGDANFFASASDDYLDSGVQVSLMIRALGKTTWHEQGHKISTDYSNDRTNTTSYLMGFWE